MSLVLRIGAVRGNNISADFIQSGQDAASSDTDAHDIPVPDEVYRRPAQSYPGCFGLPYQDHNYGMPPPLSPIPPKSPSPPPPTDNGSAEVEEEAKVPAVSCEEEVVEDSVTRCICGFLHDDGYMICCDKCSVWQHIDCMEIDRDNIPDNYCCELCEPRKLDIERARMIQKRRREEIDTSATDTDPEEPANALASLGKKPVQPKPKGSKQRRVSKAGARLLKTGRLAKSQQLKRESKFKLTKKEKENVKETLKKQKVGKTGIPKVKKIKKKLNTSLTQNKADFWSFLNEPLCAVQETKENDYSPEILEFLSHAKTNGIHSPHSIGVFPEELLVRLYQVSEIKTGCKGLEATDLIVPGKAVIEFKGKVMLRHQYQPDPSVDQSQPCVLYYSKFEGLDLCIDASAFGGDARFIRRSCTPNAEMCHIIDNGNLQFIVQAKKEILKGTEITIPFDFSYQESSTCVECACGKVNCSVAKSWKKMKLAQKSPEKPKRKRQASGEGRIRRNSQSKGSPVKAANESKSPVKYSPVKSPDTSPLPSMPQLEIPELSPVHVDHSPTLPPVVKPNPNPRRSSRASTDVKEEKDIKVCKVSHSKETCGKPTMPQETIHVTDIPLSSMDLSAQPVSESEADSAGECTRKLTREERKMEAIMKAFEKLEKREERRKEALARHDKKHIDIKDEPMDMGHAAETGFASAEECGGDKIVEQPSHVPVSSSHQSPEAESNVVVKLEDSPIIVDSPQKSVRNRRMKRKRRNSRVMSALEPLYSSPVRMLTPTVMPDLIQAGPEEVKEEPVEQSPPATLTLTAPITAVQDYVPFHFEEETPSYLYHKKKKYLMTEQSGSRSPNGREEEMFVSCAPGPRSSMEHIQRRYSTSATYGRVSDSAIGSAKKRWLRQAMHETEPLMVETITSPRPPSTDSSSPPLPVSTPAALPTPTATATSASASATATATASVLHSPTGSPSDFVTPLKKRRLAPEFLPSTSSAALSTPPCNGEATAPAMPPAHAEPTASSSHTDTPAAASTNRLLTDNVQKLPSAEGKRPSLKGTCLFGKKTRNGFIGTTDNDSSVCVGPVPESSAPATVTSARGTASQSGQDELFMDGSSSVSSHPPVSYASAGSSASSTMANSADIAEASEGSSDSPGATASSSSMVCVAPHFDSPGEMPLVDSSDAARDPKSQRRAGSGGGSGDNVGVCSSDNAVSTQCVHSADSNHGEHSSLRQDEVVTESSSASTASRSYCFQDEDGDVSESQPVVDRMEVEEEGNEATGSVSLCEELSMHAENVSRPVSQPATDCQVNSSQDFPSNNRTAAISCSPGQAEAECNITSFMSHLSHHSLPAVDRSDDCRQVTANDAERAGVSSAQDSDRERERNGVSSAKDTAAVSSVVSAQDSESLASSDVECGPSSSTQTLHRRHGESVESMVCNSSDVTGSSATPFLCEESNADSTTQSGRVVRSDLNHCDTADSHVQASESEESCCDSNTDEQAIPAGVAEGAGVSSSGPADSQCDVDRGPGGSTGNCVLSGSASVSSSVHSRSHSDHTLSMFVSSSLYSSSTLDSAPGRQVSSMIASTSSLSTTETSDLPGPSQSTSVPSHALSDPFSDVDSPSVRPTSNAAPLLEFDSRESDSVDTSEPSSGSPYPTTEQCEASTSSVHGRRLSLSDDGDPSTRPVSSSLMQSLGEGELPVSSISAESDMLGERVTVNGDHPHGGMVSSFSEDSSGSSSVNNPCTSVSSSEAQAAPIAKRKVSLSEYRNRRKDKPGCAASTSTSPKSSSDQGHSGRATLDSISLAPLPLFEPITIGRDNRDSKESEREKPMSLEDRLRIEFGLETSCDEDDKASSSGHRKSSDIPPPPPLPPNGKLGGVGVKRTTGTGPRRGSAEKEEDGRHASPSSYTATAPSAVAATTTLAGLGGSQPLANSTVSQAASHTPMQPGYTWLAKLHSGRPTLAGATGSSQHHQQPSTSAVFTTGSLQQQHPPLSYNAAGAGSSQLPNGSHPQAPTSFSPGSGYTAPSTSQGQPQSFTPSSTKQQQQAPPPPPLPNTAYSQFFAQSRTLSLHPQTSPIGPGHHSQPGRSSGLSQTVHTAAMAAHVGNGVTSARRSPANPSSNHPHGLYHYDQFSRSETVKHKGSVGTDRKRH